MKVIGGTESGKLKAVASGTLPNGKPVVVNADGTVSVVGGSSVSSALGSPVVAENESANDLVATYDSTNGKVIMAYRQPSGNYLAAVVGTVSGTSISFGSKSSAAYYAEVQAITYDSSSELVVIFHKNSSNHLYATAGTVSGTSISLGGATAINTAATYNVSAAFYASEGKHVVAYRDNGNSGYGTANIVTVTSSSITKGTATVFESSTTNANALVYDSTSQKMVNIYKNSSNDVYGKVSNFIGSTNITFGSATLATTDNAFYTSAVYDSGNDKVVYVYQDSSTSNAGAAIVGTVSGSSISFGSKTNFNVATSSTYWLSSAYDAAAGVVTVSYKDNANSGYGTFINGTVSGTSISFGSETVYETAEVVNTATVFDSSNNVVVTLYRDAGNSYYGTAVVIQNAYTSTNLTAENYVGMSQGYTDRGSQSVGSATTFEAANVLYTSATFDSNSNKVVIAYRDSGNSNYGTAVVGTVSGTSISFGSPAVFNSDGQTDYISTAFDSANNKVVIAYRNLGNSNYGTAIVGTVSGTSISFGSASVFNSGTTTYPSLTFDTNASKIVVAYQDNSNSFYGTAAVGTVSGTSISFGTEVVFNSGITSYTSAVFDSSNNKVVIGYQDASNSNYGTAIVGTVSGTSISFGSEVVFESARVDFVDSTFDSFSEKVIFAYKDEANSNSGTAVVGTVSGTSVSFGTPVVFQASYSDYVQCVYDSSANKTNIFFRDNTSAPYPLQQTVGTVSGTSISFTTSSILENVNASYIGATFDSNVNKVVVTYRDESNSYYGKAIVFQNAYDNSGSVADGDPARTDIIGSVSTNQSGLTAGEKYYVQTDGTLSTTAGDPSVLAGTAISATKLVVKT